MTIAAIMNTINRSNITPMCTEENIARAGVDFDLFITDNGSTDPKTIEWGKKIAKKHTANEYNMGNPYALNRMIADTLGYDYIVKLDNDILLPENWLVDTLEVFDKIREVGMLGWVIEGCKHKHRFKKNEVELEIDHTNVVIGTTIQRSDVFKKIGYLNEFSNYGHWDATFCRRVQVWYDCFYMPRNRAHHLGNFHAEGDFGYAEMKQQEAAKALVKAKEWHDKYHKKKVYLTLDQKVI